MHLHPPHSSLPDVFTSQSSADSSKALLSVCWTATALCSVCNQLGLNVGRKVMLPFLMDWGFAASWHSHLGQFNGSTIEGYCKSPKICELLRLFNPYLSKFSRKYAPLHSRLAKLDFCEIRGVQMPFSDSIKWLPLTRSFSPYRALFVGIMSTKRYGALTLERTSCASMRKRTFMTGKR